MSWQLFLYPQEMLLTCLVRNLILPLALCFCLNLNAAQIGSFPQNTKATKTTRNQKQLLCKELISRWEAITEPDFVASSKAVLDEAFDGTMSFKTQYVKQLLASDTDPYSGQISSLMDFQVYSSLQHQMKSIYLVSNLKDGVLIPREGNGPLYFRKGVYLELHKHSNPKPFYWGDVELHFDYTLLDRNDYYMSAAWSHGDYWPDSASPAISRGRTRYLIEKVFPKKDQNEIVFSQPVSLKYLIKIVVPTGTKASLIEELVKENIPNPTRKSWDELIAEQVWNPQAE